MTKKVIDDFEHMNISKYGTNHTYVESYDISLTNKHSKYGSSSLKVTYDYSKWTAGNGAMYIKFHTLPSTNTLPKTVGVWIYGTGEVPWLRLTLLDGKNERKTLNLTQKTMKWHGWKYLDANIDPKWALPLSVEQLYAVEIDKEKQGKCEYRGVFYIDRLQFVYEENKDLKGPFFKNTSPQNKTIYNSTFTFQTTVIDEMTGTDPETIEVKINGKKVKHIFCSKTNEIMYSLKKLTANTLHITVSAKDFAGNPSIPPLEKNYEIDLSPDEEKPIISNITPYDSSSIYARQPRISFRIIDKKSGVDSEDIHVKVNETKLPVYYDETTGWGYALVEKKLPFGIHTYTIMAEDRAGNKIDTIHHSFQIQEMRKLNDNQTFYIGIIPDTHSSDYTRLTLNQIAQENVDFIIQMGDLVDQATFDEFVQVKKDLQLFNTGTILTTPGNHESFQGNLNKYLKLFGTPTYHIERGNTLFIFLNTAFNQSITESDSTQLHYLKKLLDFNRHNNIVIVTHVPTKDPFGTAHEMNKQDAKEIEGILANYKKQYPNKNITVLFGHLHVIHQWIKDGIKYVITGNSARKGYVSNDNGNILGYGILKLSPEKVNYYYKPFFHEMFIGVNDKITDKITIKSGSSSQLQLYIKVQAIDCDYIVDISEHTMIQRNWESSNTNTAKIDKQGTLYALKEGKAKITVEIMGKTKTINIVVNKK